MSQVRNERMAYKTYKVNPNRSTSIASGTLILSIGIVITIGSLAFSINSILTALPILLTTREGFTNLMDSFSRIIYFIGYEIDQLFTLAITGWVIGGIVAGFVYKKDGSRGPIYSSLIAISLTLSLGMVIAVISIGSGNSGFNLEFLDLLASVFSLFITSVMISLISIPLILIAMIGYRIGMYFSRL